MTESNSQALAVVSDKPTASMMKLSDQPSGGGLALGSLEEVFSLGKMLAGAGYFSDADSQAKAVVKILYGQEMGISPMAAMNGLYVYKGKVCMYADLINDKIKASGILDFKVKKLTATECVLEWFHPKTKEIYGESDFTLDQAKLAGLVSKDTWKAYPKNMLFARALTFGLRLYGRQVFAITPYSAEEMIDQVDPNSSIIEGTVTPALEPEKKPRGSAKVIKAAPTSKDAPIASEPIKSAQSAESDTVTEQEIQADLLGAEPEEDEEEITEAEIAEDEPPVMVAPLESKASKAKFK